MLTASSRDTWIKRAIAPGLMITGLLLAIIVINPFREMFSYDDGWAYARSVQHLLATGRYQLDNWAAANMPVQIWLAAGLSKLAGYSIGLLRCSTLLLLIVGIGSFYALLRELSHTREEASVLSLGLMASPMVLMLSFTFMSDIQFLGWLLLSLWLYVRGIHHRSAITMFLGSLAAGCAIGTRQFGIAIIGGLVLSWLLSKRDDKGPIHLLLIGLLIPIFAAAAQIHMGLQAPNFTQAYRLAEQHQFLSLPAAVLLKEMFWRCAVIVQYLGLSLWPVFPLIVLARYSGQAKRSDGGVFVSIITILISAAMIGGLYIDSPLSSRHSLRHRGLLQPLQLNWLLPSHFGSVHLFLGILAFLGIAGGVILVWMSLSFIQRMKVSKHLSPQMIFLMGTGAGMLALHFTYVQLNDTYIVALIPFAIIVIADRLRGRESNRPSLLISAALSMMLILILSLWLRGEYSGQLEAWRAADALVDSGVQPSNIDGPILHNGDITSPQQWAEYHDAFDTWIAAGTPGFDDPSANKPLGYDQQVFYSWLASRGENADYRIVYSHPGALPSGWQIIASHSYRNFWFSENTIWTLKRIPKR